MSFNLCALEYMQQKWCNRETPIPFNIHKKVFFSLQFNSSTTIKANIPSFETQYCPGKCSQLLPFRNISSQNLNGLIHLEFILICLGLFFLHLKMWLLFANTKLLREKERLHQSKLEMYHALVAPSLDYLLNQSNQSKSIIEQGLNSCSMVKLKRNETNSN